MRGWHWCTVALGSLLVSLWGAQAGANKDKPIVAVFDIVDRGAGLSPELLLRLSDFLASSLAATGAYQVVPRSQLKQRLVAQKKASYKQCYDQACQIEIGKELAAQKSLSTAIVKLGATCTVTAVLYDLRTAASEGGASAEGPCEEQGIAASIKRTIGKLSRELQAAAPLQLQGSLLIDSTPPGAVIWVDGRKMGWTPAKVLVAPGARSVKLEKRGWEPVTRSVTVKQDEVQELGVKLEPTAAERQRQAAAARRAAAAREARRARVAGKRRSKTIWGYTTLAVGVALCAGAGALLGVGVDKGDGAYASYKELTGQPEQVVRDDVVQQREEIEDARKMVVLGGILAGAAVLSISYAVFQLMTRPELPGPPTTAAGLQPTAGGGVVTLQGVF